MRPSRALLPISDTAVQADESTQERVLNRAAELFWTKGYAATTTREIAASLGIRQASLYHHVASKENLLCELCTTSLEQLLAEVQSAVNESNGAEERIRILVSTHLNTLLKYRTRHALMLTELRALSGTRRRQVLGLRKRYEKLVLGILSDGQSAGFVRADIPAKYLCLALLNILNWAVLWFRGDEALSAIQLAEIFARAYIDGATTSAGRLSGVLPELEPGSRNNATRRRKPRTASERPISARLLNTAAALFAKQGYALTSTREIAAQVGIQKASLYYHIAIKEDLLYDICKSSLKQIRSDVEAALQSSSNPLERTAILIRTHIESMLRDQDRHSAALTEMFALSAKRLAEVTALRDAYESLVRSVLDKAQIAGVLRQDVPVKYLCLALLGLLNRVLVWFRPNGPLSPNQIGALFANIYLTGAAAEPKSTRPPARAISARMPAADARRGPARKNSK
jgi:TetR/AcrR family transcriptional regulator, cholesterol catabolism regulator